MTATGYTIMVSCSTYVQKIRSGGFFAVCRVHGPDPFPDRRTLAEAERDASAHGELAHIYSIVSLREHDQVFGSQETV